MKREKKKQKKVRKRMRGGGEKRKRGREKGFHLKTFFIAYVNS